MTVERTRMTDLRAGTLLPVPRDAAFKVILVFDGPWNGDMAAVPLGCYSFWFRGCWYRWVLSPGVSSPQIFRHVCTSACPCWRPT